ncbi:MAG: OmpH family outer membrane protein, partial [Bacteroidia bacterium]
RDTEAKLINLQSRYQKRQIELQEKGSTLQQKISSGTISAAEAEIEEKAYNAGIEDLARMETELGYLQNSAAKKNEIIVDEVSSYFKEYSKTKGIDFILGYGSASNVLYANDSLDVTADVLNALNATYRSTKGTKSPKK